MRPNEDIRRCAGGAGVYLWQVAQRLGIADTSLSRKMRVELSPKEKQKIIAIIDELAAAGAPLEDIPKVHCEN